MMKGSLVEPRYIIENLLVSGNQSNFQLRSVHWEPTTFEGSLWCSGVTLSNIENISPRTLYILSHALVHGSYDYLQIKRMLIVYQGMPLFMGVTVSNCEGDFSINLLIYRELIGQWQLALLLIKKCSWGSMTFEGSFWCSGVMLSNIEKISPRTLYI